MLSPIPSIFVAVNLMSRTQVAIRYGRAGYHTLVNVKKYVRKMQWTRQLSKYHTRKKNHWAAQLCQQLCKKDVPQVRIGLCWISLGGNSFSTAIWINCFHFRRADDLASYAHVRFGRSTVLTSTSVKYCPSRHPTRWMDNVSVLKWDKAGPAVARYRRLLYHDAVRVG